MLGYSKNFILSVLLHGILLGFLLFSFATTVTTERASSAQKREIIQAVVIDEKRVTAEVQRLQKIEKQKKSKEENQQKLLTQKLKKMEEKSAAEQKRLTNLKSDMAKLKKTEEKRLSDLKVAREKEEKQLKMLQLKNKEEKKQLAAIEKEQAQKKSLEKKRQTELAAENQQKFLSEKERWKSKLRMQIEANRREGFFGMSSDLVCELNIVFLPDGSAQVQLIKSSGNSLYDDLSIKAVYRSEPFELPDDPRLRQEFKTATVTFKNDRGIG